MTTTELVCIQCPRGCRMEVKVIDNDISVYKNKCNRGKIYAVKEFTNPTRMVTSTVRVNNGNYPVTSVKTSKEVSKDKIFEVMNAINDIVVSAPLYIGQVVSKNVDGDGTNIIITREIEKVKNYKAIIYDIDGTLLNTERMNMVPLQKIIKEELGIDIEYKEILKYAGMQGMMVMEKLNIKDKESTYKRWVQYVNEYPDGATVYPGIEEALEKLKSKYRQAIMSSKFKEQYDKDMEKNSIDSYMEVCVLADDTKKHKPDPEPLLLAIEKLGLTPSDVIYVGDTVGDYLCCVASNVDFALAKWGNYSMEGINNPAYILENPTDLEKLL